MMHSLLKRQIKRHFADPDSLPEQFQDFLDIVDHTYAQFDDDRELMERSLELSSDELFQANSELRTIFSAIPDLFFRVDREGRIIFHQAGSQENIFSADVPLIGKQIQNIPSAKAGFSFTKALEQVRETGKKVSINYTLVINQAKQFFEARLIPLPNDQTIVIIRNVTEKLKLEEEITKSEKLESVGILAGGIAHDFNNILSGILGYINLAQMEDDVGSKGRDYLVLAEKASYQARDLTQQLLTFAKGGNPVKKDADMNELLRESIRFLLSGSNVKLELTVADDLDPVMIDSGQMNQVINNLIINADQAMPHGGKIHVRTDNCIITAKNKSIPLKDGKYIRITIQDAGCGIEKEDLSRIFVPYFTTKEQGNGLGLASSYAIIKKHRGHIAVQSEVSQGTTFSIYLPVSQPKSEVDKEEERGVCVGGVTGNRRILLMDDDKIILEITKQLLNALGYEAKPVLDGVAAIAAYQQAMEQGNPFDAVILDLTIPGGMGGEKAVQGILAINPAAKIIVSSGYSNDRVMSNYRKYGFTDSLSKPYRVKDLNRTLHALFSL